ncbi:SufD family Fe-S cluster assembly protein [Candidatus Bathyarchaeota archaeon]|nr:SufD family Fe-S cluster assembly protein [Candidatus Bathyarchaeota archaeon]
MKGTKNELDLDPSEFTEGDDCQPEIKSLNELSPEMKEELRRVGLMVEAEQSAGTYLQQDQSVSFCQERSANVEVMPIQAALDKHEWLGREYSWNVVPRDLDQYTEDAAKVEKVQGYFIRSLAGHIEKAPVQTCLYMRGGGSKQVVHNIIIAEEGSEMNIVTGCAAQHGISRALHEGISEFYVKKNAKITFTMIHEWEEGIEVRPRSAIYLEEGAQFINNYVILKPVKAIQSNPIAYLKGDNSRVLFQTMVFGKEKSYIDVGSRAILDGRNTSAEMITRAIATDASTIIARGLITGNGDNAKGHLECRGMILSNDARIDSIPELDASNTEVDITHEAAVGKIAQEEIQYLQARGATEDEATSMIINGFLSFDFSELPPEIAKETQRIIDITMDAS